MHGKGKIPRENGFLRGVYLRENGARKGFGATVLRRSAANNWQISTSCLYFVEQLPVYILLNNSYTVADISIMFHI